MNTPGDEIVVGLTADTSQLKAGMAEGVATVQASSAEMASSVQEAMESSSAAVADDAAKFNEAVLAKREAWANLQTALKGGLGTQEELYNAELALDEAQRVGAVSAQELSEAQAQLAAAEAELTGAAEASTAAQAELATAEEAVTLNSRAMGEISTAVSEVMAGNFGRLRRTGAALANQTGILQSAFTFLLSPAGLVAAAFAAIAAAALDATNQIDGLQRAARAGGGYVGMPPGDLEQVAQQFKQMGYDVRTAREAIDILASSGKVTSAQLAGAAESSLALAKLTHTGADEIAKSLVNLSDQGIRGVEKLNEHYHFLTAAQFDHIDALFKEGNASQAVAETYDLLGKHANDAVLDAQKATGMSEGLWASMGTVVANSLDSFEQWGFAADTVNGKIQKLDSQIKGLRAGDGQYEPAEREQKINDLLKQRETLLEQLDAARQKARAAAKAEEAESNRENAIIHKQGDFGKAGKDGDEAALQQQEYAAQQQGHEMSLAEIKAFWQQRYDIEKDGGAQEAQNAQQAMAKMVEIQKQIDEKAIESAKEQTRQEAAAARESERETRATERAKIASLEVIREKTKEASADRIKADQDVMTAAAKFYGEDSREYAAALAQKNADQKAFNAEQYKEQLAALQQTRETTERGLQTQAAQYELLYQTGQISADQLANLEIQLVNKKLAAEISFYQEKEKLDKDDVAKLTSDQKAIIDATQRAATERLQIERRAARQQEQIWKQYAKRISSTIGQETMNIITQHETMRKALGNIAMQIGNELISAAIEQPLEKWLTAESMKLAASLRTLIGQSDATATQRTTDTALDIADKTASVARAAGVAGAQGVASFAGAPWPVDIGAPAFGAAMAAEALAFAGMASAAGGWDEVPADGMLTMLHKKEMVLPAHIADPVREMAKRGGGGSQQTHYHISALDARSFKDMLRRNPAALASGVKNAHRRGHIKVD